MKRLIMIAAVAVALLSTACKKDWNCECTTTSPNTSPMTSHTVFQDMKKSDAEDMCKNNESVNVATNQYGINQECHLK